jgi:hypothetical protein
MPQKSRQSMAVNGPQKLIKALIYKGFSMAVNLIEVVAKNTPYQGLKIFIYDSILKI